VLFIAQAVPGDKVLCRLEKVKSSFAEGRVTAILSPSPRRVEPKCKFFGHCGGCQWLAAEYPLQLEQKESLVRQALRAHLSGAEMEPIAAAEPARGYRHRGDFHVRPSGDGVVVGFYMEASHRLVNLDFCLLFDQAFNARYAALRKTLQSCPAARHLAGFTLARSEEGDRYALHLRTLDSALAEDPARLLQAADLSGLGDALVSPIRNVSDLLAAKGDPSVTYTLPGPDGRPIELRADVRSFTQAHYPLNRSLVETAVRFLSPAPGGRLLDLYSGIGNFTIPLALAGAEVTAVESSPFAHADAQANAARLPGCRIRHLHGDAARWTGLLADGGERFDGALLDPPRSGAKEILPGLLGIAPPQILYVSCNLPALERDLGLLRAGGYRLLRLRPFDAFPQTYGVETLALLERT
jgi:23S rRNA (uracil1939-C5)-methyltransferase